MDGPTRAPALEVRGVDVRFGPHRANRGVSLTVAAGTIHGVIGENGAGKSTIMNAVYGLVPVSAGDIRVGGRALSRHGPREAIAAGVGMVHQHFMLVESFTAEENLLLGAGSGADAARLRAEIARCRVAYGLDVPLDLPVSELTVGARQKVEILKALSRGADLLILDEPTAVLAPAETEHLLEILRGLRDQGRTVVLISHKLREILAVTDRVTVMRAGAVVAEVDTARATPDRLAELMVGRRVAKRLPRAPARPGAPILAAEALTVAGAGGRTRLRGVSLTVHGGEIVGVAGVSGNGQSELLEALAGMRPAASGRVLVHGRPVPPGAAAARRAGIAHVPEDRERVGLVAALPAWENAMLGHHADAAWNGRVLVRRGAVRAGCAAGMAAYDVRPPDPDLPAAGFSGGNQQKIVLAREIERDPDILLVGQPTRGVDIGAVEVIHRRLIDLRDRGKAVLLVSSDLDEILALSDRVLVLFEGRIVGDMPARDADPAVLGALMTGGAPAAVSGPAAPWTGAPPAGR